MTDSCVDIDDDIFGICADERNPCRAQLIVSQGAGMPGSVETTSRLPRAVAICDRFIAILPLPCSRPFRQRRKRIALNDYLKRHMSNDTSISIVPYREEFDTQIVDLILHIQNVEAKVGISAQDQPDILSIRSSYFDNHGGFWVALLDNSEVVGTIGLQRVAPTVGVLKKFFVHAAYRGMKGGPAAGLYSALFLHARATGVRTILLDTPAVATRSHAFYQRAGFKQIEKADLPVVYDYPDRSSLLFRLDLL